MQASVLISSLLAHLAQEKAEDVTLDTLVDYLYGDDPVYRLAVLADTKLKKDSYSMEGIASFLSLPENQANDQGGNHEIRENTTDRPIR